MSITRSGQVSTAARRVSSATWERSASTCERRSVSRCTSSATSGGSRTSSTTSTPAAARSSTSSHTARALRAYRLADASERPNVAMSGSRNWTIQARSSNRYSATNRVAGDSAMQRPPAEPHAPECRLALALDAPERAGRDVVGVNGDDHRRAIVEPPFLVGAVLVDDSCRGIERAHPLDHLAWSHRRGENHIDGRCEAGWQSSLGDGSMPARYRPALSPQRLISCLTQACRRSSRLSRRRTRGLSDVRQPDSPGTESPSSSAPTRSRPSSMISKSDRCSESPRPATDTMRPACRRRGRR